MAEFIYQMYQARKAHGDKVILDDVTLSFYPGAKIGVVGPNGMGKSTLLKIMAGIEEVSNGDARLTPGYTVGIPSLGSKDTIAPAVSQGNQTLLDWLNEEIKSLGEENFFHKDYEETLVDTYGLDYEDELVVEGGETAASEAAASEAAASEVASSAAAQ